MQILRAFAVGLFAAIAVVACGSTTDDDEVTFTKSIEPLVQEKCQRCHRDGGIAPFALVTYADVKKLGHGAKDMVVSRQMPPWGAFDDDTCKMQHKFRDDLSLTQAQIDLFARWVDEGMKEGDADDRPPPKTFAPDGLPNKTHTFSIPEPYRVAGDGKDDMRCFPIDPGFTKDTWIAASNVMPGDPRVVHHVIVFTDPHGEGAAKAGAARNYPCFGGPQVSETNVLFAWAPGVPPTHYGDEAGIKIEKGSKLVAQIHYHSAGVSAEDRTSFELEALGYKPGYVAQVLLAGNAEDPNGKILKLLPGPNDPPTGPAFVIPPNVKDHTESMEITVPEKFGNIDVPPLSVYAVASHMHWAGVDMKIEVERANPAAVQQPAKECLLGTPKYNFNWQRGYAYDAPMDQLPIVGPGDKVRFTCKYDNTTSNKFVQRAMAEQRMSSPPEIHLGETTLDEMCLGVLVLVRRANLLD